MNPKFFFPLGKAIFMLLNFFWRIMLK